jgi:hypothetical protein
MGPVPGMPPGAEDALMFQRRKGVINRNFSPPALRPPSTRGLNVTDGLPQRQRYDPTQKKFNCRLVAPIFFSLRFVLWLLLTSCRVQSQNSVCAIHGATRRNTFLRSNLASSNLLACLDEAYPGRKILWSKCRNPV